MCCVEFELSELAKGIVYRVTTHHHRIKLLCFLMLSIRYILSMYMGMFATSVRDSN